MVRNYSANHAYCPCQHWLLQHGYPLEDGGYVPGAQGFGDAR
jgi:hypothetical protein